MDNFTVTGWLSWKANTQEAFWGGLLGSMLIEGKAAGLDRGKSQAARQGQYSPQPAPRRALVLQWPSEPTPVRWWVGPSQPALTGHQMQLPLQGGITWASQCPHGLTAQSCLPTALRSWEIRIKSHIHMTDPQLISHLMVKIQKLFLYNQEQDKSALSHHRYST